MHWQTNYHNNYISTHCNVLQVDLPMLNNNLFSEAGTNCKYRVGIKTNSRPTWMKLGLPFRGLKETEIAKSSHDGDINTTFSVFKRICDHIFQLHYLPS